MKHLFKTVFNDPFSIIIIGIFIRLLIAPFTLHWDLLANTQVASKWGEISVKEFYSIPLTVFPPLIYTWLKTMMNIFSPLLGKEFLNWLNLNDLSSITHPYLFRYIFLLKLPMIFIEVLTGILFSKMFEGRKRQLALIFWFFNPIVIYLVSGWTNVDALPILFFILSLLSLNKERLILSSFFLGIASGFKLIPILFFPFLLFYKRNLKSQIFVSLTFLLPLIASHIQVLNIPEYFQHAITSGYRDKILFSIFPIGPDRAIIVYYFLFTLLFLHYRSLKTTFNNYFSYCFLAILPVFAFSFFNMQWFLWLTPFLIYYLLKIHKSLFVIFVLYLSYLGLIIFSQASLNLSILAPISLSFWVLDNPVKTILGSQYNYILNTLHTILSATLIWIGYELVKRSDKKI